MSSGTLGVARLVVIAMSVTSATWVRSGNSLFARLHELALQAPNAADQAVIELDTNHNGFLEFAEVLAYAFAKSLDYNDAVKDFVKHDADRDGRLCAAELAGILGLAAPPAPMNTTGPAALASEARVEEQPRAGQQQAAIGARAATTATDTSAVAEALVEEAEEERQAHLLDSRALELRANATALASRARNEARERSAAAGRAMAEQLARKVLQLEDQAAHAEVTAAALRAKVEANLRGVRNYESVVASGLADARGA